MKPTSRSLFLLFACAALAAGIAPRAHAQCMLANPSFEIAGQSGAVFGGWSQMGVVATSLTAHHGSKAALVSGPNTGNWDISGFWQPETSAPGDRWVATGWVRVPSASPLAGNSKAIVNVEWRNSGGALISYESHDVATASMPVDSFFFWSFTSAAAPTGTASARLVVAVLQGPGDPQRQAIFDQVTFVKQTTPSLDALQWGDFGSGRTVSFAGRTWRVKGPGYYGPGPNWFSNSTGAVFTDAQGRLHLTIAKVGNTWYSTEVALTDPLGYGDYVFTTRGRLDTLDPQTVLGLYVWEYGPCYDTAYLWWNPYNETDIEFSRWGVGGGPNAQYVTQPYDWGGNRLQFTMNFSADEVTSHAFRWRPDRIEYRSWRGGPNAETPQSTVRTWTYTGPHIPRPDQPRVHLNLWQFTAPPAITQEVVFEDFTFRSWPAQILDAPPAAAPGAGSLAFAGPHPVRGATRLRFVLPRAGAVRVGVYDVSGRCVRTLSPGTLAAGAHELAWDARDEQGAPVAPGVYVAQLDGAGTRAALRVVVLR